MKYQIHILNGDSLKDQFPENLNGKLIVLRECLVDGDVKGETLEDLFDTRAEFISSCYDGFTKEEYVQKTVSELLNIKNISKESEINLWFEDDLFCQVNFWFAIYVLNEFNIDNPLYLVRPTSVTQYGFASFDKVGLSELYEHRSLILNREHLQSLWQAYQSKNDSKLLHLAKIQNETYPFILPAVEAHLARFSLSEEEGRPVRVIKKIMKDLGTVSFGPVFQEFNKREPIYGFGDLQVRRLYNSIISKSG